MKTGSAKSGAAKTGPAKTRAAKSGGTKTRAAKSGSAKAGAAEAGVAKSGGTKTGAAEAGAAKSGGTKSGGAKSGAAKSGAAKSGGAKSGGAKDSAGKSGAPRFGGARSGTARFGGAKSGAARSGSTVAPEREEAASGDPSRGDARSDPALLRIVGVGASAGGLEALERFFDHIPADTGISIVVVQHLSPDFKSLMDQLLARHTPLRIEGCRDGVRPARDTVYLIPPRCLPAIEDGVFRLREASPRDGLHLPIDEFFRSLAKHEGSRSVGIILSGSGSDGTRGVRAIKEAGGIVIVQKQSSARFDGMPRSAIATGVADAVLVPESIGPELLRLLEHPLSQPRTEEEEAALGTAGATMLDQIVELVRDEQVTDFSLFKSTTLRRRVERRMSLGGFGDVDEYAEYLRDSDSERAALARSFLIGVTRFFRDPEAWSYLEDEVLPGLLDQYPSEPLRVWVPACSTGEEAYSVAIAFHDALAARRESGERSLKVFATDVDPSAIGFASRGSYSASVVADLPPGRLKRHFRRDGDQFTVSRAIRESVIFAQHDVVSDPPFTKVHQVSFRNLLIYLQNSTQRRVLSLLHYALMPGGVLFLGSSETCGGLSGGFRTISESWKIYEKSEATNLIGQRVLGTSIADHLRSPARGAKESDEGPDTPLQRAFAHIAQHVAVPSVLVDQDGHVLHVFGDVSPFFGPPSGRFTDDIARVLVEELSLPVATGVHRVLRQPEAKPVEREVTLKKGGESAGQVVTLKVERLESTDGPRLAIVSFSLRKPAPKRRSGSRRSVDTDRDEMLQALNLELRHTRESLQATIEELETSNEELQSTNEELVASNEELQSTNEELHSVNEELFTVNAEYQSKISELTLLTDDFENHLRSTDIATLFLSGDERLVRRFTPAMSRWLNLLPQDVGRPLEHITPRIKDARLVERVDAVMASGGSAEAVLRDEESGAWILLRVLPFLTQDGVVSGAVLTVTDITAVQEATEAFHKQEIRFRELAEGIHDAFWIQSVDEGCLLYVNSRYESLFGRPVARLQKDCDDWIESVLTEERPALDARLGDREGRARLDHEFRIESGGQIRWVVVRSFPIDHREGTRSIGFLARDITKRKTHAMRIERSNRELEQFASVISHDLQEPIRSVRGFLRLLDKGGLTASPTNAEYFRLLNESIERMERQVRDLLHFSRVTSVDLEPVPTDCDALLDAVLLDLSGTLEASGARVERSPLPTVVTTPSLMRKVFQNLIENAVKYRSEVPPVIRVHAERLDEEWRFTVRDNGIGIRPEHHERVFEMFKRLNPGDSVDGTGVGLSIARKIVERHGGQLWVESSEPGVGSTFALTIVAS